jgi:hypothetical protein
LFDTLWNFATNPVFDVKTKLFRSRVILPSTYSSPVTAREFSEFNNAYLQLVHECYRSKNQKLNIIDVGAAVGDTFLLIRKNIPKAILKYFVLKGILFFLSILNIM